MIIEKIVGNISDPDSKSKDLVDYVSVEWYEVQNSILHKVSRNGMEVGIRNHERVALRDGDILWQDDKKVLLVEISECDCIALRPTTMLEMGKACYEIGNRHSPIFIEDGEVLTPYDAPLMTALSKCGFLPRLKSAKLTVPLGGHADGHSHH